MLVRLVASATDPTVPGWKPSADFAILGSETVLSDSAGLLSVTLESNANLEPDNTYYEFRIYANGSEAVVYAIVPNTAGPFDLYDILVSPPPSLTPLHEAAADPHPLYVLELAVPGGELGGTYAVPTVDASHSGSTHAAAQAAAEATAAAALVVHAAAGDPHPAYETSAEAQAKVDAHAAAGDPHPTYLTAAEANAAYDAVGTAAAAVAAHAALTALHPGFVAIAKWGTE